MGSVRGNGKKIRDAFFEQQARTALSGSLNVEIPGKILVEATKTSFRMFDQLI